MVGKYSIDIYNNRVHFHLEVKRNITVIQGDSATGKSQMIALLSDFINNGASSGVTVVCDCPCTVLTNAEWRQVREFPAGNIVFVDEDFEAMYTKEFAEAIRKADNYFVLICRDSLFELAYSIEEIYGMRLSRESQKYSSAKRVYNELYQLYYVEHGESVIPDCVITEDTNAGHEFFRCLYGDRCVASGGKSKILYCMAINAEQGKKTLAIADGAAFGAEMEKTVRFIRNHEGAQCVLYAPESFEYLVLSAGLLDVPDRILYETWEHADSKQYISWEDFFSRYLVDVSQGTPYQYTKRKLNPAYLGEKVQEKIGQVLPEGIRPVN